MNKDLLVPASQRKNRFQRQSFCTCSLRKEGSDKKLKSSETCMYVSYRQCQA